MRRPLRREILDEDYQAIDALAQVEGFKPGNPAHTHASLSAKRATVLEKKAAWEASKRQTDALYDDYANATWEIHKDTKGSRNAVKSQFGDDSNEAQMVGFKKESEIRRGNRRPESAPEPV